MPSEARQKKIMEKLNRAQKCSILGPQNLGSGEGPGPPGPPPGSAPGKKLTKINFGPQIQTANPDTQKSLHCNFLQYIWFFTLISQLLSIFIIFRVFRFVDNIFLCYILHLLLLFVQKFF